MARSHGRCPRGARLRMGFPHGHRNTTTLVAGLRLSGMVAPMVLDERTVAGLRDVIGRLVDLITPAESAAFFTAAGYEPE